MTVENDLKWDDKLEEIKNSLLGHFKENGYGVVIPSKKEDESKEKEIKEITWFILTKEKGKSFQSNGFIVEKKDNLYTCKLKWWAGTKQNKERWAGVDKKKKEELTDDVQEKAVDSLISVCEKKWNGAEKPKDGNGQRGMNVKIADIPIELAENKEKLTREFVNPIFSWEKSNMQEFEYIQGELKKGRTESEIENIKQRLVKGIQMKEYIDLLLNNHNIILHGAPGTGKTYLAKDIAKQLIFGDDEVFIDKTDDELDNDSEKIEKRKKQEAQFNEQYCFVQFHQSYDYTDFVEGLRPKDDGKGNIVFERKDGVFKEFCKKAIGERPSDFDDVYTQFIADVKAAKEIKLQTPVKKNDFTIAIGSGDGLKAVPKSGKEIPVPRDELKKYYETGEKPKIRESKIPPIAKYLKDEYSSGNVSIDANQKNRKYIFVIDEVNRGEMSKIMGELFFSIDPGYRGIKGQIKTQYQNLIDDEHDVFVDGFYVPENVYIIGTMNDIDRSVESMDFAMRRRFAFKEITAKDSQKSMFGDGTKWKNGNNDEIDVSSFLGKIEERMNNLNNAILNKEFNLGQAYQIGGAYFLKFANYCKTDDNKKAVENQDEAYKSLWTNHLECVIREYLRGMDNVEGKDGKLEKLKDAYDYKVIYKDDGTIDTNAKNGKPSAEAKGDHVDGKDKQTEETDV